MVQPPHMLTRPFPFERLPKLTRHQVRFLRRLRALFDPRQIAEALQTAGAMLGGEVAIRAASAPEIADKSQILERLSGLPASTVLLWLEAPAELDSSVLVEISAAFAERLVDRTLGGDPAQTLPPTLLPLDELSRGALAYFVARVLGSLGGSLRLRHVSDRAAELSGALGAGPFFACGIEVSAGRDSGAVRAFVPLALPLSADNGATPRPLRALPLTLIAQIGSATFSRSELQELRLGDVVVLDHTRLVWDGRGFAGSVTVQVAGSGTQLLCRSHERGLSVESLSSVKEPKMTNGRVSHTPEPRPLPDVASDAPLELSVELARFSLTLGELQRTGPGDVLVTGRRIGEVVTLRVAGTPLAEGELVDVEGEVGVRITRMLAL